MDLPPEEIPEVAHGWTHGTAEKLHSLQPNYALSRIERIGDWPKLEFINDDARILKAALAASPLGGGERANRHIYHELVTPRVEGSWRMAVEKFLDFIAFEPTWRAAAEEYLDLLSGSALSVELHAFDKKHFFFASHQAQSHKNAMLGYVEIIVRSEGHAIKGLFGTYTWDGKTCPSDAEAAIDQVYGSVTTALWAMYTSSDDQRYEQANTLHGFIPVLDWLDDNGFTKRSQPPFRYSLGDFLAVNSAYADRCPKCWNRRVCYLRTRLPRHIAQRRLAASAIGRDALPDIFPIALHILSSRVNRRLSAKPVVQETDRK